MTENEWVSCADPSAMLEFLKGKAGDRKLRLFACACCRAVWGSLTYARSRNAVEVAERYADGQVDDDALRRAHSLACEAVARYQEAHFGRGLVNRADLSLVEKRLFFAAETAYVHKPVLVGRLRRWLSRDADLSAVAPDLLRDIFGPCPSSRPATADPEWLTSTVLALARGIYDECAFDRMPYLADALMDAGCDSEEVLEHCRGAKEHVRGCWLIDELLGLK